MHHDHNMGPGAESSTVSLAVSSDVALGDGTHDNGKGKEIIIKVVGGAHYPEVAPHDVQAEWTADLYFI